MLFSLVLFLWVLIIRGKRKLLIYEKYLQPPNLPFRKTFYKGEYRVYYSDIKFVELLKIKENIAFNIHTTNDDIFQIWNPEEKAKDILMEMLKPPKETNDDSVGTEPHGNDGDIPEEAQGN